MAIVRIQDFFSNKRQNENFVFVFSTEIKGAGDSNFSPRKAYIPIDATLNESYQLNASITDNEIQDGEVISDHIHLQPQRISIKGVISESPVFFLQGAVQSLVDAGVRNTFDIVSGATGLRSLGNRISRPFFGEFKKFATEFVSGTISSTVFGENDRKAAQFNYWKHFLLARFHQKELFSIKSGLYPDELKNVFFESITFDRNYKIGDSLVFDCVLKQVRVVGSDVIITNRAGGENHEESDRGDIQTREVNSESVVQEVGNNLEQTYPKVPIGSITKIEDRIRTELAPARRAVTDTLNKAKSKIRSFTSDVIGSIF